MQQALAGDDRPHRQNRDALFEVRQGRSHEDQRWRVTETSCVRSIRIAGR
jgi:hypothetical protein